MTTQQSRWDDNGTTIPAGHAKYVVEEQPIAEYDNKHNHDVVTDIGALFTFMNTFDANTILKADVDDTPTALTVAEQTIIGRITAGVISALTPAQVRNLLNVADGADVTGSNAPQAHETSHRSGSGDAIKLDDLAATDDNTDLDATTAKHGLLKKLGGGTSNFLRADGNWETPPVAGGTMTSDLTCDDGVKILHQAGAPFTIHGSLRSIAGNSYDVLYDLRLANGWTINVLATSVDGQSTDTVNIELYDVTNSATIHSSSVTYHDSGNLPGGFPVSATSSGLVKYEVRLNNSVATTEDCGGFIILQIETP